ncbi:hypothetical protein CYMTET_3566 [Cymbomonas tetramitiformis]|uniref:Histone deacetylase domain-containing protein n=1 Tax=Cymbomonas tetramitiformis TaxID=36881 RepID=A0AAE0LL87_9CHLO|nr:hypothetical protein CYMTET_3566 [Cymbomonas tetramitiformis]
MGGSRATKCAVEIGSYKARNKVTTQDSDASDASKLCTGLLIHEEQEHPESSANAATLLLVDTFTLVNHNLGVDSIPHIGQDVFDFPSRTQALVEQLAERKDSALDSGEKKGTWGSLAGVKLEENTRAATDEDLLRNGATSRRYLTHLKNTSRKLRQHARQVQVSQENGSASSGALTWEWLDWDETTIVTPDSEHAARRAVGAVMEATEAVWSGRFRNAFVACRPPGHHNGVNELLAKVERNGHRYASHGGCLLNETAVAVHHLRHVFGTAASLKSTSAKQAKPCKTKRGRSVHGDRCCDAGSPSTRSLQPAQAAGEGPGYGAQRARVCILDVDVHFGDGTAWQFYFDPSVLTVSLHLDQSDDQAFPYLKGKPVERGDEEGRGANINLPLPEGSGDAHAWNLLHACAFPRIEAFKPEIIFVAFGTDGLEGDPTAAGLKYTPGLLSEVVKWCSQTCPKVICTLQGGYQAVPLAQAVEGALMALTDILGDGYYAGGIESEFQDYIANVEEQLENGSHWWSWNASFEYEPAAGVVHPPISE